jgi:hypoxanthine phosphoribosyltransferase
MNQGMQPFFSWPTRSEPAAGQGACECPSFDSPYPEEQATMRVLLSTAELSAGIDRLSERIRGEVGRRPLTVVGVLTGSIVLVADLIRRLEGPVQVSMVWASSYRGTDTRPGELELRLDLLPDLEGQDVLLVDDIFDTGHTLEALLDELRGRGAASVRSLVLLRKQGRAEVAVEPDFVGFEIPDEFVVGYGLDFDGAWRHLPYLAVLDEDEIAATRAAVCRKIHENG